MFAASSKFFGYISLNSQATAELQALMQQPASHDAAMGKISILSRLPFQDRTECSVNLSALKDVVLRSSYEVFSRSRHLIDAIYPHFTHENLTLLHGFLIDCAEKGDADFSQYLIDRGARVQANEYKEKNPLHIAAYSGNVGVVRVLLAHKDVDVNQKSCYQLPSTHPLKCKEHKYKQLVECESHPHNALSALALSENPSCEIAELLLNYGIDIDDNMRSIDRLFHSNYSCFRTPLQVAIALGNDHLAEFLINRGAKIIDSKKEFEPPFHLAIAVGKMHLVRLMVHNYPKIITGALTWIRSPMDYAIMYKRFDIVIYLANQGAEVTPYHIRRLAEKGSLTELKELLRRNPQFLDQVGELGNTSLHYSSDEHPLTAHMLIDLGADLFIKNKEDDFPVDIALEEKHYGLAYRMLGIMLEKHPNRLNSQVYSEISENYSSEDGERKVQNLTYDISRWDEILFEEDSRRRKPIDHASCHKDYVLAYHILKRMFELRPGYEEPKIQESIAQYPNLPPLPLPSVPPPEPTAEELFDEFLAQTSDYRPEAESPAQPLEAEYQPQYQPPRVVEEDLAAQQPHYQQPFVFPNVPTSLPKSQRKQKQLEAAQ